MAARDSWRGIRRRWLLANRCLKPSSGRFLTANSPIALSRAPATLPAHLSRPRGPHPFAQVRAGASNALAVRVEVEMF